MGRSSECRIVFAPLLLAAMLAGCGGGSNGGSSPPSLPSAVYNGATTPATIGTADAAPLTANLLNALNFATSAVNFSSINLPSATGPSVNQTVPGIHGGEVLVQGQYVTGGDAWLSETFTNYGFDSGTPKEAFTVNGEMIVESDPSTSTEACCGKQV